MLPTDPARSDLATVLGPGEAILFRPEDAMKRALAALVVTVVAIVLLARYENAPPAKLSRGRRCGREDGDARPRAPPPGVKTGTGPLLTTPFSSIQVRARAHARSADRRAARSR